MLLRFIFKRLSQQRQAEFMRRRGIVVGTRRKGGRESYLYMVNNLFAEIFYENDNPRLRVESLVMVEGLAQLNNYLERDVRGHYRAH